MVMLPREESLAARMRRRLAAGAVAAALVGSALVATAVAPATAATTRTGAATFEVAGGTITATVKASDIILDARARTFRTAVALTHTGTTLTIDKNPGGSGLGFTNWRPGVDAAFYGGARLVMDDATHGHGDIYLDSMQSPRPFHIDLFLRGTLDGHRFDVRADDILSVGADRATRIVGAHFPSSTAKGRTVTVSGTLQKAWMVEQNARPGFAALPGEAVQVWFDPSGTARPVLKGTTTTGRDGKFSRTFTAPGAGRWTAKYVGRSGYAASGAAPTGGVAPLGSNSRTFRVVERSDGEFGRDYEVTVSMTAPDVVLTTAGKRQRVVVRYSDISGEFAPDDNMIAVIGHGSVSSGEMTYAWTETDTRQSYYFDIPPDAVPGYYEVELVDVSSGMEPPVTFTVRRQTRLVAKTSDSTPAFGQYVTLSGTLSRLERISGSANAGFRPARGAPVQVWFDPAGSQPAVFRGTATVNSTGAWSRKLKSTGSGTWKVTYSGSDSSFHAPSSDTVKVVAH